MESHEEDNTGEKVVIGKSCDSNKTKCGQLGQ